MLHIQKTAGGALLVFIFCMSVVALILVPGISMGQQGTTRPGGRVFRDRIQPHWYANSTKFWYRNDLPNGQKEFVVVDATKGMKSKDFDHDSVASTIQTSDPGVDVSQSIRTKNGDDTEISFENKSPTPVEIFWISGDGKRVSYGKIAPGARKDQHTFGGHTWVVVNDKREDLGVYDATDQPLTIKIDGTKIAREPTPDRRNRGRNRAQSGTSPDGQWKAFVKDHNVFIKGVADTPIGRGTRAKLFPPAVFSCTGCRAGSR